MSRSSQLLLLADEAEADGDEGEERALLAPLVLIAARVGIILGAEAMIEEGGGRERRRAEAHPHRDRYMKAAAKIKAFASCTSKL